MEKVKYRYNRWRLALGRLVNLRYINRRALKKVSS